MLTRTDAGMQVRLNCLPLSLLCKCLLHYIFVRGLYMAAAATVAVAGVAALHNYSVKGVFRDKMSAKVKY